MVIVLSISMVMAGYAMAGEKGLATYEKDVKPIIAKRCVSCHGSNAPAIEEFDKDKEGFKKQNKGPGWTLIKTSWSLLTERTQAL